MKKHFRRIAPLLLPLVSSFLLASCVVPGYQGEGYHSSNGGGVVYTTLPGNYSGDAYFYNGRYYSGGRYETGKYHSHGRTYGSRYYHKGQYYYGGNYQNHSRSGTRPEHRRDSQSVPSSQRPSSRSGDKSVERSSR